MTTNRAGKYQSVVNADAYWVRDHVLRTGDIVNDVTTLAGATLKAALSTLASIDGVQLLSNKSFPDASTFFVNSADNTKKINFNLAGFTTGTSRTWTIPPFSGTVMLGGSYSGANLSCGDSASALGSNACAFGPFSSASSTDCCAFGLGSSASAVNCSAFGRASAAGFPGSSVFGRGAQALGTSASVFGLTANAYGNGSAFGASASAGTDCSAFGAGATSNNSPSSAFGSFSSAQGIGSTAIGANATANFNNTLVAGRGGTATANNQLVIRVGNSAVTELRSLLTTDATARATLVTHLPIELNGVTYYIKLYQT